MATPVEVPKLGNTVEECIISRWLKRPGDAVRVGDVVAEIETDKATFEVTAPVDGTVLATFFEEGALAPVFSNLFVIGDPGESVSGFEKAVESPAPPTQTQIPAAASGSAAESGSGLSRETIAPFSPRARKFAEEHKFYPEAVRGSGPGGRVI